MKYIEGQYYVSQYNNSLRSIDEIFVCRKSDDEYMHYMSRRHLTDKRGQGGFFRQATQEEINWHLQDGKNIIISNMPETPTIKDNYNLY
jgi:hypothetical protein